MSHLLNTPTFDNKINHVVSDFRECVKAVITIMNRKPLAYSVVGMDCEMARGCDGKHPIPVILQLANPDGFCAIFQLKNLADLQDETTQRSLYSRLMKSHDDILLQVLQVPFILKVGVGVMLDASYLEEEYNLLCKGCLDIRHVAEKVGVEPKSLDDLAMEVLGRNKIKRKTKDPWENKKLSEKQIEYAAEDARLCVEIFMKLNKKAIESHYSQEIREMWDEKTYWYHTMKLWEKYIGKEFVFKETETKQCNKWSNCSHPNHTPSMHRYAVLESAGNEKMCTICGGKENKFFTFMRKSMVPADYNIPCGFEQYFYLCKTCLDRNQEEDHNLRDELREKCGAPYPEYKNDKMVKIQEYCDNIALEDGDVEYILFCEQKICSVLNLPESDLCLDTLATIKSMECLPGTAHGLFVHDYFERFYPDGVDYLRWIWCNRFITKMKPKFLPQWWRNYYWNETRFDNSWEH